VTAHVLDLADCAGEPIERVGGKALGAGPDGPRHLHLLQARPETVWSAAADASRSPGSAPAGRIATGIRVPRQ
jgi:hypothetical protein